MAKYHIRILEPIPTKRGFLRPIFAMIEVYPAEDGWVWRQVDELDFPLNTPEKMFPSQDLALNDALERLDGIAVEVNLLPFKKRIKNPRTPPRTK